LALLPLWFPWVLKPALNRSGLRSQDYERISYGRFALRNVTGAWKRTRFEAARIDAALPIGWAWRWLTDGTSGPPLVNITDWRLNTERRMTAASTTRTQSMSRVLDNVLEIAAWLRLGLPAAHAVDGTIEGDSWRLEVPRAELSRGRLTASLRPSLRSEAINVTGELVGEEIDLFVRREAQGAGQQRRNPPAALPRPSLRARLTRETRAWQLDGEVLWLTNRAKLSASFAKTGWWPAEAQLLAQDFRVPAAWLRMDGWNDPTLSAALNFASNRFDLRASGTARPASASQRSSPAELALHVFGDADSATVQRLRVQSPWLAAQLTGSLGIERTGALLPQPAQLHAALDLAKVPGVSWAGKVDAVARVELKEKARPVAQFDLAATDVRGAGLDLRRVAIKGTFDWPVLKLTELSADLGDGSKLKVDGDANVAAREIAHAQWRFTGVLPQQLLPGVRYRSLEMSGQVRGPLTNLLHSGEFAVEGLQRAGLKALNVQAAWEGERLATSSAQLLVRAGESVLSLQGGFRLDRLKNAAVSVSLRNASLQRGAETLYTLQRPCALEVVPSRSKVEAARWRLAVDGFEWRGGERELALSANLDWPADGAVQATVRHVHLADFGDFVAADLARFLVTQLGLDAHWSGGPIRSVATVAGSVQAGDGTVLTVSARVRSGAVVEVDQLKVLTAFAPALMVSGTIPVAFHPARPKGWLVPDGARRLALRAELNAVERLALDLGKLGQVAVVRPRLQAEASGTLDNPSASLVVQVASLNRPSPTNHLPGRLEQLQLSATVQPRLIELQELSARIDGHPLQARGQWPLPSGFWTRLATEKKPPDWSRARGQLRLEQLQLAPVARYFPKALAPEGRLDAELALEAGRNLRGLLLLTNAATRPLGKLTPLRDIAARVRFDGHQAALEEFRGQIGGQPVRAAGRIEIHSRGGYDYQLHLQASNVPLARTVALLLRGDFDLRLDGSRAAPPVLSGQVSLQDGLYVQHATALMLSRPERPALRPPYFRVTTAPFADWKLDVAVRGDRFLRVRTPVFDGIVSANLKLLGSLHDPVATGDARVNSGRVLFPFGVLRVDQAYATLDGSDPRGPDLLIHASGRNYGYDVRLEITGPADGANVVFSSTPPLSSEETLLMLTAGELPKDERVFSTRARVGRLATFLGRDFLSRFSGDETAGERLTINTGENISEEGKLTYSVEYRLTDRWSLLGEYDRFNALNGAVKWKLFAR
jgi:translocation and assembly module TamB